VQGFLHFVELEGLDDRFDLFHFALSPARQPGTAGAGRICGCHTRSIIKNRANGDFSHLGELMDREKGGIATFGNNSAVGGRILFACNRRDVLKFLAALPIFWAVIAKVRQFRAIRPSG
jgi:hypothetical protein